MFFKYIKRLVCTNIHKYSHYSKPASIIASGVLKSGLVIYKLLTLLRYNELRLSNGLIIIDVANLNQLISKSCMTKMNV